GRGRGGAAGLPREGRLGATVRAGARGLKGDVPDHRRPRQGAAPRRPEGPRHPSHRGPGQADALRHPGPRASRLPVPGRLRGRGDLGGSAQVFRQDARVALPALAEAGHRFDVVYLDPPYASDLYEPLLGEAGPLLAEGGVVVAEHFHKRALPETIGPFVRTRSVRVGDHRLTFYRRHDPGTP